MIHSAIAIHSGPLFQQWQLRSKSLRNAAQQGIRVFRRPPDPTKYATLPGTGYSVETVSYFDRIKDRLFQMWSNFDQSQRDFRIKRQQERNIRRSLRRMTRNAKRANYFKSKQRSLLGLMTAMPALAMPANARENPREFIVDTDSIPILVDNGSSASIWRDRNAFINYQPLQTKAADAITGDGGITGLGGTKLRPLGKGTVQFEIEDNQGEKYSVQVEDTLYLPDNPINLFSPQQWCRQRELLYNDQLVHCDTKGTHLLMEWTDETTKRTRTKYIPMSGANVGVMYTNPGYKTFRSFAAKHFPVSFPAGYVSDDDPSDSEAIGPDPEPPPKTLTDLRSKPVPTPFADPMANIIPPTNNDDTLLVSDAKLKNAVSRKPQSFTFRDD